MNLAELKNDVIKKQVEQIERGEIRRYRRRKRKNEETGPEPQKMTDEVKKRVSAVILARFSRYYIKQEHYKKEIKRCQQYNYMQSNKVQKPM